MQNVFQTRINVEKKIPLICTYCIHLGEIGFNTQITLNLPALGEIILNVLILT